MITQTTPSKIPQHIAIIMDGNGKWAKKRLLPKVMGHKKGAETAKDIITACKDMGIKYLTLYVFSTENWNRPQEEVNYIMDLLREYLNTTTKELVKEGVCLKFIGNLSLLPNDLQELIHQATEQTKDNEFQLILALSYGSREEIKTAAIKFARDAIDGKINMQDCAFENYLYTKDVPDPDLLIRTGGEYRISNFLLWQLSYAELHFTDRLWPDFSVNDLKAAITEFIKRERRYGGRYEEAV